MAAAAPPPTTDNKKLDAVALLNYATIPFVNSEVQKLSQMMSLLRTEVRNKFSEFLASHRSSIQLLGKRLETLNETVSAEVCDEDVDSDGPYIPLHVLEALDRILDNDASDDKQNELRAAALDLAAKAGQQLAKVAPEEKEQATQAVAVALSKGITALLQQV